MVSSATLRISSSRPGRTTPNSTFSDITDVTDLTDVLVSVGEVAPHSQRPGRRWMLVAAATIVVIALGLLTVVAVQDRDNIHTSTNPVTTPSLPTVDSSPATLPATTTVAEEPLSAFSGNWTSTDTDGSAADDGDWDCR